MKLLNNIPKVFFGFLIASAFIWLLINFSKNYTSEVVYEVNYVNLAQDKIFKNPPPKEITLKLKGTGFKLLGANFSNKPIDLDLTKVQKKKNGSYFFLEKNIKNTIQKQLSSTLELTQIEPDSINIFLGSLYSKKVPIKHDLNLSFELGYDLASPIIIKPDSTLISGNKEDVINIKELILEPLTIENISENIQREIKITPFKNKNIKVGNNTAEIILEVDKFTEGEIEVPVEVKNIPTNTKVNIFPKKVTITYKVGLNNFSKINSKSFQVVCDYKYANQQNLNFLIPEIKKQPEIVSAVKISPSKIDFLVTK